MNRKQTQTALRSDAQDLVREGRDCRCAERCERSPSLQRSTSQQPLPNHRSAGRVVVYARTEEVVRKLTASSFRTATHHLHHERPDVVADGEAFDILRIAVGRELAGEAEATPWVSEPTRWCFLGRLSERELSGRRSRVEPAPRVDDEIRLEGVDLEFGLVFEERTGVADDSEGVISIESSLEVDGTHGLHSADGYPFAELSLRTRLAAPMRQGSGDAMPSRLYRSHPVVAKNSGAPPGIFPPDSRNLVNDTTVGMFNKVAALNLLGDKAYITTGIARRDPAFASASFVGPRVVATAAHNFKPRHEPVRQFYVVPAKDGSGDDGRAPFGFFTFKLFVYPVAWRKHGGTKNDWSFGVVREKEGYPRWFGATNKKKSTIVGKDYFAAGYPSPIGGDFDLYWCNNNEFGNDCGDNMYYEVNAVLEATRRVLSTEFDATSGQSGSPLVDMNKTKTGGHVIGVLSTLYTKSVRFRRFTNGVMKKLCKLVRKYKGTETNNPKC